MEIDKNPFKFRLICYVFLLLSSCVLTGCVARFTTNLLKMIHDVDVSAQHQYWGGFQLGDTYRLEEDIFLMNNHDWGVAPPLVPSGELGSIEFSAPESVQRYVDTPIIFPEVTGVVERDILIQVVGFRHWFTDFDVGFIYALGEIKSGTHMGTVVNLFDLTILTKNKTKGEVSTREANAQLLSYVSSGEESPPIPPVFPNNAHRKNAAKEISKKDTDFMYADKEWWGDFYLGQHYITQEDLFIIQEPKWGIAPALTPPENLNPVGAMEWKAPRSVDSYVRDTKKWPSISGILEKGSEIRIVGIREYEASIWSSSKLYALGKIENGDYEGQVVNIFDLTLDAPKGERTGMRIPYIDRRLLKKSE